MSPAHLINKKDVLVVAGMHRSGTSAIARILSLAGGRLPDKIMAPGPDNPLGFWEPYEMVGLNDAILASVNSRWDDIFGHRAASLAKDHGKEFAEQARRFLKENFAEIDLAILKDPRTSLVIPFWEEVLRAEGGEPVYVIMVRHPLEVAQSIAARSGAPEASSVLVWAAYMLAVERDTRSARRVFVDYGGLLSDWRAVLKRIEASLHRPLPERSSRTDAEIDGFLSGALRHHDADGADLKDRTDLWPKLASVYQWLQAAARSDCPDPGPMNEALAALEELASITDPAVRNLRAEAAAFPAVRSDLEEAKAEIEALRTLANQFHAEADHNGRHLEAARDQVAHLRRELALAQAEAANARHEARQLAPVRREIAMLEASLLRQVGRNVELDEAMEQQRRLASAHTAHSDGEQARLSAEIAQLSEEVRALQTHLQSLDVAHQAREADLSSEISDLTGQLLTAEALTASAGSERDRLAHRNKDLVAAQARLLASPSWRLTQPLRVTIKRLKAWQRPQRAK